MSSVSQTLARVVAALDAAGARHMIVGSFASTFHGEPRKTQDIDIVVELGPTEFERLLAGFPEQIGTRTRTRACERGVSSPDYS